MKPIFFLFAMTVPSLTFADSNAYVYQALVPTTQQSCDEEAASFAERFSRATGIQVEKSLCQSVVNFPADKTTYPMYSLAIRYRADRAVYPYSAQIGKLDLFYSPQVPFYNSYASCLDDVGSQVSFFETHTGLVAVAATCEQNTAYEPTYTLRIDGFDRNAVAVPKKRLFQFAPQFRAFVSGERFATIGDFVRTSGAVIVKQIEGNFAYYAEAAVGIKSDRLAGMRTEECGVQIEHARSMYFKAGARNALVWCLPQVDSNNEYSDLQVVHDTTTLSGDFGWNAPRSFSFNECLSNRDLVLSDSRNQNALGGICSPSVLGDDRGLYVLELFRKY